MNAETRPEIIERAVLAALMHHKPDYRSPKRLHEAAMVIANFVEGELPVPQAMEGEFERVDFYRLAKAFGVQIEKVHEAVGFTGTLYRQRATPRRLGIPTDDR